MKVNIYTSARETFSVMTADIDGTRDTRVRAYNPGETRYEGAYRALIDAYAYAMSLQIPAEGSYLNIFTDSEFTMNQLAGRWPCRDGRLLPLLNELRSLGFEPTYIKPQDNPARRFDPMGEIPLPKIEPAQPQPDPKPGSVRELVKETYAHAKRIVNDAGERYGEFISDTRAWELVRGLYIEVESALDVAIATDDREKALAESEKLLAGMRRILWAEIKNERAS